MHCGPSLGLTAYIVVHRRTHCLYIEFLCGDSLCIHCGPFGGGGVTIDRQSHTL